jgi:CBS-domain-containing membrane protein
MARINMIFDSRFKNKWLNYIAQSTMAAFAILLALVTLRQQNLVVAASLAATAFTIFIMPHSITASMRNVVGGYIIAIIFGSLFAIIPIKSIIGQDIIYAVAVGCSMFLMAVTNTEHPPAAGTTLGILIDGFSSQIIIGIALGVGVLTIVHWLLKPILLDLIASIEKSKV